MSVHAEGASHLEIRVAKSGATFYAEVIDFAGRGPMRKFGEVVEASEALLY